MTEKTKPSHRSGAAVLRLSDFRGTENHSNVAAGDAPARRAEAVRQHIERTLLDPASPAVAAATVYIDAHGHVGISAAGIEPEMATTIADELRQLAGTIELHQHRGPRRSARKHERGYTSLAAVAGIAFITATYMNPFDWLDAALSLAAQVTAAILSARTIPKIPNRTTTKGTFESSYTPK